MEATNPVAVRKITVYAQRVRAEISCAAPWHYSTPKLAEALCAKRPHLAYHTCVNGKGETFGAVVSHTPMPHVFEHLVVDLLVEQSASAEAVHVGTSEWIDHSLGLGVVEVSFENDLDVLLAFRHACELLNETIVNMTSS